MPPEVSNGTGRVISKSVKPLVPWTMRWATPCVFGRSIERCLHGAKEQCLPVCRRQVQPYAQIHKCVDGIGDGTVKSDESVVYFITSNSIVPLDSKQSLHQ